MSFAAVTVEIAHGFPKAKTESLKAHPLAKKIERDWQDELRAIVAPSALTPFLLSSSAGIGAWNAAPWLAVFHPDVTRSARAGFYPVYLFEPGFKTVCLVMGQGAASLEEAVGKKAALVELARRAELLRNHATGWADMGFSAGRFETLRKAAVASTADAGRDPWSIAVAFGKRYVIDAMLTDQELSSDLVGMLNIYADLVRKGGLEFAQQDDDLLGLKQTGELPKGTVDGAKQVLEHKRFETRKRNSKLIAEVKKNLGYACSACDFKFGDMYGRSMAQYIEAHHLVPISTVADEGVELSPTDEHFAVLCSNCHRAIHAAGCPPLPNFKNALQRKLKFEPT